MTQDDRRGASGSSADKASQHVAYVRQRLSDLADHLARDTEKVDEPKALALFETTREVLKGLAMAYEHYTEGKERAWRQSAGA